jgi:hypothetical protein
MKNSIIIATALLVMGCGQAKEVQSTEEIDKQALLESATIFAKTDLPYQKFTPSVKFFTPTELPGKTMYQLVDEQKQFVASSGLPTAENMAVWVTNHSLNDAIASYKAFKVAEKDNKYLRSFRQYSSWMILTKLNLLSTTRTEDIAYFTNELVDANYNGFGLLNYLLETLTASNYDRQKISNWAATITNSTDAKIPSQPIDVSKIKINGVADFHANKTQRDVIEFIEKKHLEYNEDLQKIKKYIGKK